jgi:hypothetical protein
MSVEKRAAASTPATGRSAGPNPEYPDWHPDLAGPHFQSTGGPNGTAFSIAITRPGSAPKTDEENQKLQQWRHEMENPPQMLEEGENDEEVAPHRNPTEESASPQPRHLGMTTSGRWEAWLEPKTGKYPLFSKDRRTYP